MDSMDGFDTSRSSTSDNFSFLDSEDSLTALCTACEPHPPDVHPHDDFDAPNQSDVLHQPLYDGANLTTLESSVLLMQFSIRHRLSKAALGELLQLVMTHLPESSQCTPTTYKLKQIFTSKFFQDVTPTKQYFCTTCEKLLPSSETCKREGCCGAPAKEFIYLPLDTQIKHKIEG